MALAGLGWVALLCAVRGCVRLLGARKKKKKYLSL
jgi:hypothetical protein